MLHPRGQAQDLPFAQHYVLVPSAALSHALGHIAPLCSRRLLTVSIMALHCPRCSDFWCPERTMSGCVCTPSSTGMSKVPLCIGPSSGTFPWAEFLGMMNIYSRLDKEILTPRRCLCLLRPYTPSMLYNMDTPFMPLHDYIQTVLPQLEMSGPWKHRNGGDGSLCHLLVRKFTRSPTDEVLSTFGHRTPCSHQLFPGRLQQPSVCFSCQLFPLKSVLPASRMSLTKLFLMIKK